MKIGIWRARVWVTTIFHYNDVIMGAIASQITGLTIVFPIVYSDADQRKHQSPASLAIVRGIHRGPVNSPHKWPVTRKMFPFDYVIMQYTTTEYLLINHKHWRAAILASSLELSMIYLVNDRECDDISLRLGANINHTYTCIYTVHLHSVHTLYSSGTTNYIHLKFSWWGFEWPRTLCCPPETHY